MRVAIVTYSISHFEVPLYRLAMTLPGVHTKVFHIQPMSRDEPDPCYCQKVDWGFELDGGYARERVDGLPGLCRTVFDWAPSVAVVYGYSWPGALQFIVRARKNGLGLVHRGTLNHWHDPRRPILSRLRFFLQPPILRMFHTHQYGGSYSREVLRRAGIPQDRCFFVPYSVDTEFFRKAADDVKTAQRAKTVRANLGWGDSEKVILWAGQLSWFKGPDIAIRVFEQLSKLRKDSRLLVVGSGAMAEAVLVMAKRRLAPGSYHFQGFVSSALMPSYYLSADVLLLTSRYETWARATNEAMLCNRVCVVNRRVPAAGDLVIDGVTGFVVGGEDIGEYVCVLDRWFSASGRTRMRMESAARGHAENFSYERYLDRFAASIECARGEAGADGAAGYCPPRS